MVSATRKMKRKKSKEEFKNFRKQMSHFRKMVKCSICGHKPGEEEKIDTWRIEQKGDTIKLMCDTCCEQRMGEEQ